MVELNISSMLKSLGDVDLGLFKFGGIDYENTGLDIYIRDKDITQGLIDEDLLNMQF